MKPAAKRRRSRFSKAAEALRTSSEDPGDVAEAGKKIVDAFSDYRKLPAPPPSATSETAARPPHGDAWKPGPNQGFEVGSAVDAVVTVIAVGQGMRQAIRKFHHWSKLEDPER
ncbi:hypothetical protein [Kineosporia sp. NBRC 101731]|uniref:hypothetical protein n=1 Tax=Kineosporia sp. NBRC 101731 TaxID=3032199 RepID=UPI00249F974A|nr:hypothetical protein [Kineosporia sp. NBRC 101731]GLY29858.1 hypothetical protein Kisp02_32230 [Kineosporia sp. NBRC 101731]